MPRVYVSVGSNVEPEANVRRAMVLLEERFGPVIASPIYESPPVGFEGDNFLNLVVAFDSEEGADGVHDALRHMEEQAGRRRDGPKFTDRRLDLDLLLYGDEVRHGGDLELPRDEILKYAFMLRPLADIAPDLRHPELGRTYGELWAAFHDPEQDLWPVTLGEEGR